MIYYIKTIDYYNSEYKIEMYAKNYGYKVHYNNYSMCHWQKIKSLLTIIVVLYNKHRHLQYKNINRCQQEKWDIQEHRIIHNENPIQITTLTTKTYLKTSSAWRNNANAAVGGVGIVRVKNAYNAITEIKAVCPRILSLTFNGNPKKRWIVDIFIGCYLY